MAATTTADQYQIAARMERLPISHWHNKMRLIIGTVNFCDAFDSLSIAYVLPVLIPMWHMKPSQIGALISVGFLGQILGGVISGWLGERYGRIPLAIGNIVIFSVMSVACIFAHSYNVLLTFRFLQGIGLGGEVPIVNTYISEFAKSTQRGRFVLIQQVMFPVGLTAVALAGIFVVPLVGWQWMFALGGLPVLLVFPMISALPESPRWLASRSRYEDADRMMRKVEELVSKHGTEPLPPIPTNVAPAVAAISRFRDLFRGIYLRRTLTLWVLWFCAYLITYGLSGWLPSIMRTVYHTSVAQSNLHGFVLNLAGLFVLLFTAFTIDWIGRKRAYTWAFLIAAVPLLVIAFKSGIGPSAVVTLATISFAVFTLIPGSLGMYTAENYPNQLRALGSGAASISQRLSSVVGPLLVGLLLPSYGIEGVFAMFGVVSIIGGITCLVFAKETARKSLEELSPATGVTA